MTDHLKASPPERYAEISRHLLEQAREELNRGNIPQASDKLWGATAHAIKSVCQRMGWNHHAHNHLRAATGYIAAELNRNDLLGAYGYLDALHTNYYEHQRIPGEIRVGIDNAAFFIRELAAAPLSELPGNRAHLSPLERDSQERRLQMLTRKNQYSHGPQLTQEEIAGLPPVIPAPDTTGQGSSQPI